MNAGTKQVIDTLLKNDPTVTQDERTRLLLALSEKEKTNTPPRLIRRKEVAARLGMSIRAVDRLCVEGALSKRVLPGRKRSNGVLESDVDKLISGEVA